MAKAKDVDAALQMIKDKDVKFVDLRFTDPRGKMQHLTMDVSQMHEDAWAEGLMFDGSSIAGWKAINESDMVLMPDASSIHMDPFYAQSTMAVFCDILDPGTGEGYSRDPRMIAKRTEAYLTSSACSSGFTAGQIFLMRRSGPMRKVTRWVPLYFRPMNTLSPQTPYASTMAWVSSDTKT